MEACGNPHYWGHEFKEWNHEVKLMNPYKENVCVFVNMAQASAAAKE